MAVQDDHEEKETITVDCMLPGHDARVTTPLFERTRDELLKRENGRSFATGKTEAEVGPLEAHHVWIERCLAEAVDWADFCAYMLRLEALVKNAADFCRANPEVADVMDFVDNMLVNGMLLEKSLHTGAGTGIHYLPFPLWQLWAYGKDGFQFTRAEAVAHDSTYVEHQGSLVDPATGHSVPQSSDPASA